MHDAAFQWLAGRAEVVTDPWELDDPLPQGLDVGAGGKLGSGVRRLFWPVVFTTIDVDPDTVPHVVADLTVDVPDEVAAIRWDVVLCTEVAEHERSWRELLSHCAGLVGPGGHLLVTCAATGREPHAAATGGPLPPGEYYHNVDPQDMGVAAVTLARCYGMVLREFVHDPDPHDLYVHLQKRPAGPAARTYRP